MNLNMSGCGDIPSGEYNQVAVSGCGRLCGMVKCAFLFVSGTAKGDSVDCKNRMGVSGCASFANGVTAGELFASGTFSCGGDLAVSGTVDCSGSARCKGRLKCKRLLVSGVLWANEEIESEYVKAEGSLSCKGALRADEILIKYQTGTKIGSVCGKKILIFPKHLGWKKLWWRLTKAKKARRVTVMTSVEGDEVGLAGVVCPCVSGRVVEIGDGCVIDLVRYRESVEISPGATVLKTEKI